MSKKFYVYVHRKNDTKEIFYVGKGSGSRCKSKHSRNKWWAHVVGKHGFYYEIIFSGISEICAYSLEKATIKFLKDSGCVLVNFSDGGEGNSGPLPMNRKPVSCSNGMTFESVDAAAKWAGVSESKISAVCCGMRYSSGGFTWAFLGNIPQEYMPSSARVAKARSKPICCSNGMRFDSGKSACKWLYDNMGIDADRANLSAAANKKIKSAYGFSWWFDGDTPVEYVNRYKRSSETMKSKST